LITFASTRILWSRTEVITHDFAIEIETPVVSHPFKIESEPLHIPVCRNTQGRPIPA
jgi:hypothetical protein